MANLKKLHKAITSILDDSVEERDLDEETQKALEEVDANQNKTDLDEETQKALEEIDDNQNEIGAPNEQASEEILKVELIERNFLRDMVSSSSEIEPKEVKSVPDKVADKVDTVDEVVKKVEEPVVESNAVESDSLNEPNENNEKTPEPVPKEEALEPASALATKSSHVPPHLLNAVTTPNADRRITDTDSNEQLVSLLAWKGCEQTKVRKRKDKSKRELQEFAPNDQVWAQDPTIASGFWAMDPTTKKWSIKASIIRARNKTSLYQVTDGVKEFPIDQKFLRPQAGPS